MELPSPHTTSTSSTTNGPHSPGPTPPTVTRSDPSNPYPTTFVQADSSSFKQVVQLLTGSSSNPTHTHTHTHTHKPAHKSKLYERRNNSLKHLRISPLLPTPAGHSPRLPYYFNHKNNNNTTPSSLLSPTLLDFPSLMLSPVTPLTHDPFSRSPVSSTNSPINNNIINNDNIDKIAEEKAIAEKGFFLHPVSPGSDNPEPRLLPLFPLSSPKVSSSHF
ncbi:hypothetical protein RND81_06G111100 [Saponaria officinalis]|uniref:VQ domain-containing protein n=1 Tax=Saponaria officinalis TaxID=3572 RepID=A0AAW1KAE8_SAPOF